MTESREDIHRTGFEIAVTGMAGRFPGARNIAEFWENLKQGVESITFAAEAELEELGVGPEQLNRPGYIGALGGRLQDKGYFDAAFFGFTPGEARLMDPQMRILHEVAWSALEDAGVDSGQYEGLIGIYAGASGNFFWEALSITAGAEEQTGSFMSMQLIDRSFLSTRISYRLNLKGPALTVQTACSTSLAAIHLAVRGILSGECEMALAGGVALGTATDRGYVYQEGMILSPDGHCRAFDKDAKGTVGGEGAGIIVLKSLEDAIDDKDYIYAVIKGSALNNDGTRKVGFSAPSVEGQAEVIKSALIMAEVEPQSIRYIETHGTGTSLGDPVEIQALKLAFNTSETNFCALGSVKTNIGHLDAAAGVTGFIKAVMVLKHRQIPPTLHYTAANPAAQLEDSPFYVVNRLMNWQDEPYPLRAGVSAFGIGGTNAHVVLEEWTGSYSSPGNGGNPHLILLSAQEPAALDRVTRNLTAHIENNPGLHPADISYTLLVGRRPLQLRRMTVASTTEELVRILNTPGSPQVHTFETDRETAPLAFMFPGQGSQYVNMGRQLYETEPVFKKEMDRCFEILEPLSGYPIKEILYPSSVPSVSSVAKETVAKEPDIEQTEAAQPSIFVIEYALARLLKSWGIEPAAMVGHSIGEYVAACLAGVFSLEDALRIVTARGRLMQQMPRGTMLGISLPEQELLPLLPPEISLAAVNSPHHCVVSGTVEEVARLEEILREKEIRTRKLHTSHAFHSAMMDPVLDPFAGELKKIKFHPPKEPFLSNLSGRWISGQQAADPAYWVEHLRRTVRFDDNIKEIVKKEIRVLVEVGPGNTLSTFARNRDNHEMEPLCINLLRHPREKVSDQTYLLEKTGRLWLYGIPIAGMARQGNRQARRIPLPTYPFAGERYWLEGDPFNMKELSGAEGNLPAKKTDMGDWFYAPIWKQVVDPVAPEFEAVTKNRWLLFLDETGTGLHLAGQLRERGGEVITVKAGTGFSRESEAVYTIPPASEGEYEVLLEDITGGGKPLRIVHLWGVTGAEETGIRAMWENRERAGEMGLFSLVALAKALGKLDLREDIFIDVITDGVYRVTGEEMLCPEKATVLGAVKVIPKENPRLRCRSIDVLLTGQSRDREKLAGILMNRLLKPPTSNELALRNCMTWQPEIEPLHLEATGKDRAPIKEQGVYLITGGLGGIGLESAAYLAEKFKARLVLVGRSPFPDRDQWQQYLRTHGREDGVGRKISRLMEMEAKGAEILVCRADVSDEQRMKEVVDLSVNRFESINGVIHSAGIADYGGVIQRRTRESIAGVMKAKVEGTLVLARVLPQENLDFFILCSSLASFLAPFGEVGYIAANIFLDTFSQYYAAVQPGNGVKVKSIDWTAWLEAGMAVDALKKAGDKEATELQEGILSAEGVEALHRILGSHLPQTAVITRDLKTILLQAAAEPVEEPDRDEVEEIISGEKSIGLRPRPNLSLPYVPPGNPVEETLARIWQEFFGIQTVGINDDFFELGGDSLRAAALLAKIHKKMNLSVPIAVFFDQANIKGLARYKESREGEEPAQDFLSIPNCEEKEYYDLSPAQERLFILHQMEPDRPVYNMPDVMRLEGEIDMERMNRTFRALIKRHESLRTSYEVIGTDPRQKIHGDADFAVEVYGGTGTDEQQGNRGREVAVINEFIRPFDLSRVPMLRIGLLETGPGRHLLMLDIHHIAADGASVERLLDEFITLYRGEKLLPLKYQYRDFSQWQNRRFQSEEIKKQEQYWLKEFEDHIPVLKLPLDNPRDMDHQFSGDNVKLRFKPEMTVKLRELARSRDVTLYVLLFAVYNVFLFKLSGQEDIVVGTVAAGRTHADLENIIGMFVNTLALRNYPTPSTPFDRFLREVKKRILDAFDNQDYQFDDLVEKVLPQRDSNRNPLFDVMFSYIAVKTPIQADNTEEAQQPALKASPYEFEYHESKFDITLGFVETEKNLECALQYSTALFKPATAGKFMNYFQHILETVLGQVTIPLKDIALAHELKTLDMDAYKQSDSQFDF